MMNTILDSKMKTASNLYLSIISACAWCGKIRIPDADERDNDSWVDVGTFQIHSGTTFSHSICPACSDRVRADLKAS